MPNTKVTRSFRSSGMSKNDGGVASQGVPSDANSTYPKKNPGGSYDPYSQARELAEVAPTNPEYTMLLPDTIAPLGAVNLGPVNGKAK